MLSHRPLNEAPNVNFNATADIGDETLRSMNNSSQLPPVDRKENDSALAIRELNMALQASKNW